VIAVLYALTGPLASELRSLQRLLRVLFVALRGLYLSRRGLKPAALAELRFARRATYRALWSLLEDLYWRLRSHSADRAALRGLLRETGMVLGRNPLCIRRGDRTLIDQYLLSLYRLVEAMYPRSTDHAEPLWQLDVEASSTAALDVVAVLEETVELRDRVRRRMQRELRELRRDPPTQRS
jgi:hypothetical protein